MLDDLQMKTKSLVIALANLDRQEIDLILSIWIKFPKKSYSREFQKKDLETI